MITLKEFLMGREKDYSLTLDFALNAAQTLAGVNYLRGLYGRPLSVSSGYRPGSYNKKAGGAKNSSHLSCEAIDIADPTGHFAKWCILNLNEVKNAGLYLEDPDHTPGWVHLQTRAPMSRNRIFIP